SIALLWFMGEERSISRARGLSKWHCVEVIGDIGVKMRLETSIFEFIRGDWFSVKERCSIIIV
ncbi:MAG: hypothetical protein ACP5D0_05920, partial [Hydrogenovibrio sp.]